jgi:hypothetical protein
LIKNIILYEIYHKLWPPKLPPPKTKTYSIYFDTRNNREENKTLERECALLHISPPHSQNT